MMILTESVRSAFETVLKNEAMAKKLQEEAAAARATIRKFLVDNGETALNQDGYYANIANATRDTLQKAEVEKLLGYKIPDTCYKHTAYTTLTIKRGEMV